MTLEAIIIRADGAFAETEELRRQAFVTAFSEAGFTWDIDRDRFAASRSLGSLHQRMAHFVRQYLKRGPDAPDVDQLIAAMHRRASKVFCQLLERGTLPPRAGIRDLIVTARQEGVRLVLAAALDRSEAESLLTQVLGARGPDAFDVITVMNERDSPVDAQALYRQVLADTGADPATCLVIEATLAGTYAAKAVGLPVITTRSIYCLDSPGAGDSAGMFEDLPEVLARTGQRRPEALSVVERAELLAALQRLHSGSLDSNSDVYGSDAMRVSDILKTKGSAVKTIEATATIRALAQGLRAEAVGAMVVKDAKGGVQGIITERDLARGIAEFGADLPSMPVSALMTKAVITCAPDDSVAAVAKVMTHRRIRHLPVVVDGALAGVVSIGDVLKHRIDEVQLEANVLREYAMARK
jgi:CBS domain-containing protein/beta-phosphoglucomutase-like phosphatase (HAD superfamily)